jgi:hypothetical protein
MKASEIITQLTEKGVHIWADNNELRIRSPKGIITPEIQANLMACKTEILAFMRERDITKNPVTPVIQGLNLSTIGRLIGGFGGHTNGEYTPPTIDPKKMAEQLKVTFKPLPHNYKNAKLVQFRQELENYLREYGVKIIPWEEATTDFTYDMVLPIINQKKIFKLRGVRAEINAVIDVENPPSTLKKLAICAAENWYSFYSSFVLKDRDVSVVNIAKISSWAEDHAAKYVEDPTNTQVIIITDIDEKFINPQIPYDQKIKVGLNTLVRTFAEIVIGVGVDKISILNMNLSDSIFPKNKLSEFVLKSLIPKVFVPISPLLLNRFEIGEYEPEKSSYAKSLVKLGQELAPTGLFPAGFKIKEVIKRKSHRDIVNVIVNGRTGVSYGFVAYAEPPQYFGAKEINIYEWEKLLPCEGFSSHELRQNTQGRRYLKTTIQGLDVFQQIPDIWLVSARSGSNKTNLNIASDIIRVGLKEKLHLELPQGMQTNQVDIKPSYDIYVMVAISLSAALYAPDLIKNGAAIVHFHGYPAFDWFKPNEYCVGVDNPSVPCGTYESGVFNFLGISSLANQGKRNISLVSLVEPDHGSNFIANDLEYLVERLKTGCEQGQIELGGKHFASLKGIAEKI